MLNITTTIDAIELYRELKNIHQARRHSSINTSQYFQDIEVLLRCFDAYIEETEGSKNIHGTRNINFKFYREFFVDYYLAYPMDYDLAYPDPI